MAWPQIAFIVLLGVSLGVAIANHRKPRTGTHNIFHGLIAVGLEVWLLIAGGFFK